MSFSARCYCGASALSLLGTPETVAYCHCIDCRRWTGAPLPAFAAFAEGDVVADPPLGVGKSFAKGVTRWTCADCGSPMAATFEYLPGQIYVPLGVIAEADQLPPRLHCHTDAAMPWLHIDDDLPRHGGTGRAALRQ